MKAKHNALAALADMAKGFLMKCPQQRRQGAQHLGDWRFERPHAHGRSPS